LSRRSRAWLTVVALAALSDAACPAPRGRRVGAPASSSGSTAADNAGLEAAASPSAASAAAPTASAASAVTDGQVGDAGESLQVEEGEQHPRSEAVTIKLLVDPPKRAHAFWGMKDLGVAPLEIRRPRGSGPLDLTIRAPGYLTIHTRAFTDRDDKVTIRMVPEVEAPRTFGYRAAAGR
jgi:hypothetical protein